MPNSANPLFNLPLTAVFRRKCVDMKISKEKRTHIILVLMVTAGVMAGLWFGLIRYQNAKVSEVAKKIEDIQQQIGKIQKVVSDASQVATELKNSSEKLNAIESNMASGDLF